ncbi:MAG: NUDIX hydrolase [Nitriliruptoraceae bacterium]
MSGAPVTEAAGGVILRDGVSGPEVLVVHRVRHGDWSLPKGKLDPGETAEEAAVREVEEETGVRAAPEEELPSVTYPIPMGIKHVRWWRMRVVDGDPSQRIADGEVDAARFVPVDEAVGLLTYDRDVEVLEHARELPNRDLPNRDPRASGDHR